MNGRQQIGVILSAKLRIAGHAIASVRTESKLKVAVISVSAVLIWLACFFLFFKGFQYLLAFGQDLSGVSRGLGAIIITRMLSVLTMVIFFLLIFSNILVAFSTLYRSREVAYLLQAPMQYRTFFVARFIECVTLSSWALGYLGSPFILAYGIAYDLSFPFYLAAVVFFVPFITLPAALGSLITMAMVRVFPQIRMRTMLLFAALAISLFFMYWQQSLDAEQLSRDTILPAILDVTAQTQSPFLPSHWVVRGLLATADRDVSEGLFYFLLIVANALMAAWICAEVAQRIFFKGWSSLIGHDELRLRPIGHGVFGKLDAILNVFPDPTRALILKDIRLFWREPTQWSQFVIFFGIMGLYIANLRNTSTHFSQDLWRSWVGCLNIGACTLILATLTSRFVYPLVSLEGRRFWIIGLAPLSLRKLVWQKFWLSVATTSVFTVTLAVLSSLSLRMDNTYLFLSVYTVLLTNFSLSGLAVGMGTLYPNFQEDNPARIVSGMGGTLNLLLSIGYITIVVGLLTVVLQWNALKLFVNPDAFRTALTLAVTLITVVSVISTYLPMRLGLRNLENMEF